MMMKRLLWRMTGETTKVSPSQAVSPLKTTCGVGSVIGGP